MQKQTGTAHRKEKKRSLFFYFVSPAIILFFSLSLLTSAYHCKYYSAFKDTEDFSSSVITLKDISGKVFTLPALLCSAPQQDSEKNSRENDPVTSEFCFFCFISNNFDSPAPALIGSFQQSNFKPIQLLEEEQVFITSVITEYLQVRGPPDPGTNHLMNKVKT